jgi:hypothetical protein
MLHRLRSQIIIGCCSVGRGRRATPRSDNRLCVCCASTDVRACILFMPSIPSINGHTAAPHHQHVRTTYSLAWHTAHACARKSPRRMNSSSRWCSEFTAARWCSHASACARHRWSLLCTRQSGKSPPLDQPCAGPRAARCQRHTAPAWAQRTAPCVTHASAEPSAATGIGQREQKHHGHTTVAWPGLAWPGLAGLIAAQRSGRAPAARSAPSRASLGSPRRRTRSGSKVWRG